MSTLLRLAVASLGCGLATAACTGASAVNEDATDGIYGSWVSGGDGGSAVRLTLTSARTYTLEELDDSSPGSAEARVESGTFTARAGILDWIPEQSSCPGRSAAYQSAYELSATTLSLALPDDVVVLRADSVDDRDSDAGDALTLGCFAADGGFTASPLGVVSN